MSKASDNKILMNVIIVLLFLVLIALVWRTIEREIDDAAYEDAVSQACIKAGGYPIVDARALRAVCLEVKYEVDG